MTNSGTKWTKEEIELLFTDMSTTQIAEKLGRTFGAVATKRTNMTGGKKYIHSPYKTCSSASINIVSSVKDESPLRSDLIYPWFYNYVPLNRIVSVHKSTVDMMELPKAARVEAKIVKKYPYYCVIEELKSKKRRCIQWSDIARCNVEMLELYGGRYGRRSSLS